MSRAILQKITKAGLVGRGGAAFPTATKWEFVKKAKGKNKYVVCNASEGELGLFKDIFILKNHLEGVFEGLILAMDYLGTKNCYFNLNQKYYKQIKKSIHKLIDKYNKQGYHFTIYAEKPSYIGGEETTLLNAIEGNRIEPRLRPPYPSDVGLFGGPTLIHNVETLYNVALVAKGQFEDKRFYCVSEDFRQVGVYHLPATWSIKKILKESDNYPGYKFFVQIGGGASGLVLNEGQLGRNKMIGAGSIDIYRASVKPRDFLLRWFKFYAKESCGKCTPCRMGTHNLVKIIENSRTIPWKKIIEIVETMEKTSFCGLGVSIGTPVRSYAKNILNKKV